MMQSVLVSVGLGVAAVTFVAILWSIARPAHRLWPPEHYTAWTPILVWVPTFTLFGVLIALGIMEWGSRAVPNGLRFGFGIPMILSGNIIVWIEVAHFGIPQTGGAKGSLRTAGMYRYSRNPQYMADIAIVGGWIILSASESVAVVGLAGIAILIAAPFSEEPWLKQQYGAAFEDYMGRVRRFL